MGKDTPIILNGSRPKKKELRQFISAISNPGSIRATGGYLFKTCIAGDDLVISICPSISEGQRLHHYDLKVPDPEHILGSISANGEFTMLFKARKDILDDGERKLWRDRFTTFSKVLVAAGYTGAGHLDWITRQIIRESEIFDTIPDTLADMAGM